VFVERPPKDILPLAPRLTDPKDDLVLELAVASGTRYVVTFNTADFKGADKFGVRPITPQELLEGNYEYLESPFAGIYSPAYQGNCKEGRRFHKPAHFIGRC